MTESSIFVQRTSSNTAKLGEIGLENPWTSARTRPGIRFRVNAVATDSNDTVRRGDARRAVQERIVVSHPTNIRR